MPRYIDAEVAENILLHTMAGTGYQSRAIDSVAFVATADVEKIRHGEWIDDVDDVYWGNHIVKKHCSRCGFTPHFDREKELFDLSRYCPFCGAKMDDRAHTREVR